MIASRVGRLYSLRPVAAFSFSQKKISKNEVPNYIRTSRPIASVHQPCYTHCNTRITKRYLTSDPDQESFDQFLKEATSTDDFFASSEAFPSFESIGIRSPILIERVRTMLNTNESDMDKEPQPSAVQAASFRAILSGNDVTIGAETGSGKTLAYLLPLLDDILQRKKEASSRTELGYNFARAIILVPNKELAAQVLRMATELCGGQHSVIWGTSGNPTEPFGTPLPKLDDNDEKGIVRLGVMPGGLKAPEDYKPFRMADSDPVNNPPLDIVITTPASLGPLALSPKNIDLFADVETLVIDEADMLFDGGYLRPLNNVLMGFRRAGKLGGSFEVKRTQHVLVAATLPDMGLKSVDAYVQKTFPFATRVTMKGMHNARHYGLRERTSWLQDDYYDETPNKTRIEHLVAMFKTDSSSTIEIDGNDCSGLKGEKVMVFLNSVSDVDGVTNALRRAGIEAVPYHAKIPLADRAKYLESFRQYDPNSARVYEDAVPILVCTDLAARGLDVPGVTAVVQLQFAGNVVAHLHRMGRCGRAGNRDGYGVIFYGGPESELVDVINEAEQRQQTMTLEGNEIEDVPDGDAHSGGKVKNAFSRKRGFTKKRKKLVRNRRE